MAKFRAQKDGVQDKSPHEEAAKKSGIKKIKSFTPMRLRIRALKYYLQMTDDLKPRWTDAEIIRLLNKVANPRIPLTKFSNWRMRYGWVELRQKLIQEAQAKAVEGLDAKVGYDRLTSDLLRNIQQVDLMIPERVQREIEAREFHHVLAHITSQVVKAARVAHQSHQALFAETTVFGARGLTLPPGSEDREREFRVYRDATQLMFQLLGFARKKADEVNINLFQWDPNKTNPTQTSGERAMAGAALPQTLPDSLPFEHVLQNLVHASGARIITEFDYKSVEDAHVTAGPSGSGSLAPSGEVDPPPVK